MKLCNEIIKKQLLKRKIGTNRAKIENVIELPLENKVNKLIIISTMIYIKILEFRVELSEIKLEQLKRYGYSIIDCFNKYNGEDIIFDTFVDDSLYELKYPKKGNY